MKNNIISLEESLTMYYLALDLIGSNVDLNSDNYNDLTAIYNIKNSHNHFINFISNYYNVSDEDINNLLKSDIQENILSLQNTYDLNMKDMSLYLTKFPMLKVFSKSQINVEGYNNILDYQKLLKKEI